MTWNLQAKGWSKKKKYLEWDNPDQERHMRFHSLFMMEHYPIEYHHTLSSLSVGIYDDLITWLLCFRTLKGLRRSMWGNIQYLQFARQLVYLLNTIKLLLSVINFYLVHSYPHLCSYCTEYKICPYGKIKMPLNIAFQNLLIVSYWDIT